MLAPENGNVGTYPYFIMVHPDNVLQIRPCCVSDATDRAVRLGPGSWIRFAPRNHPTRFLALYVHFKPLSPSGALLRRYRQCHSVFDDDAEKGGEEDKANEQEDRRADQDER